MLFFCHCFFVAQFSYSAGPLELFVKYCKKRQKAEHWQNSDYIFEKGGREYFRLGTEEKAIERWYEGNPVLLLSPEELQNSRFYLTVNDELLLRENRERISSNVSAAQNMHDVDLLQQSYTEPGTLELVLDKDSEHSTFNAWEGHHRLLRALRPPLSGLYFAIGNTTKKTTGTLYGSGK